MSTRLHVNTDTHYTGTCCADTQVHGYMGTHYRHTRYTVTLPGGCQRHPLRCGARPLPSSPGVMPSLAAFPFPSLRRRCPGAVPGAPLRPPLVRSAEAGLRGERRGGGAAATTARCGAGSRRERGGGGIEISGAAGRRWMEVPVRRVACSSLECPGEPPPRGTGTETRIGEGARRLHGGNATASRPAGAVRGLGGNAAGGSAAPFSPGAGCPGRDGAVEPAPEGSLPLVSLARGAEGVYLAAFEAGAQARGLFKPSDVIILILLCVCSVCGAERRKDLKRADV